MDDKLQKRSKTRRVAREKKQIIQLFPFFSQRLDKFQQMTDGIRFSVALILRRTYEATLAEMDRKTEEKEKEIEDINDATYF